MNLDCYTQSGSQHCAETLEGGLRRGSMEEIQRGLSLAYDLFVEYVTQERHDDLVALGRCLNAVYFPNRAEVSERMQERASYLGQLRSLVNLCDYISRKQVPGYVWPAVGRSKYAKPVLQALLKNGAMLATPLSLDCGLRHSSQLANVVEPLVKVNLVRREKFGKNVWYSLTSTGRLMATKELGGKVVSAAGRDGIFEPVFATDAPVFSVDFELVLDQAIKKHEEEAEKRLPHDAGSATLAQHAGREFGYKPSEKCQV